MVSLGFPDGVGGLNRPILGEWNSTVNSVAVSVLLDIQPLMLPKLRILQVGDVHLPTAAQSKRNLDQKDSAFSVELRNVISAIPTKVVFKQIYKLLDEGNIDALLFMGDFSDRGSLEYYERSSAFLANSLQIGDSRNHGSITL